MSQKMKVFNLQKSPSNDFATVSLLPAAWNLMNLEPYWIILQTLSLLSMHHKIK